MSGILLYCVNSNNTLITSPYASLKAGFEDVLLNPLLMAGFFVVVAPVKLGGNRQELSGSKISRYL